MGSTVRPLLFSEDQIHNLLEQLQGDIIYDNVATEMIPPHPVIAEHLPTSEGPDRR